MNYVKSYFLITYIIGLSSGVLASEESQSLTQSVEFKIGEFAFNIDTDLKVGYLIYTPEKSFLTFRPKIKISDNNQSMNVSGVTLLENGKLNDYLGDNEWVYYGNKGDNTHCYYLYLKKVDLLEVLLVDDNFTLHLLDTLHIIENAINLKRYCSLEIKKIRKKQ